MRRLLTLLPSVLLCLVALPAQAGDPLPAPGGGRLHGPDVVLEAPAGHTVRDAALVASADGKTVDVYALVAVDAMAAKVLHRRSADGGKTWGAPGDVPIKLDNRAQWLRVYRKLGKAWLVLGNNPSLPPRTPRVTHFGGKKYTGFPGWLSIARLGPDGRTCETNSGRMRLENPGNLVFSHYSWGVSFRMFAEDKTLVLVGAERFFLKGKWMWGVIATRSTDGGETWKTEFLKMALRGLNILKPAIIQRKAKGVTVDVFMGNNHTKRVEQYSYGETWGQTNTDVKGIGKVNFWHDGYEEADGTPVLCDTALTSKAEAAKKSYGIAEFVKGADGWTERGRIDAGIDKPYSALATVDGDMRAHRFFGVGTTIFSADGGKTWLRAPMPAVVKSGQSAIIPGRGYAVIRGGKDQTPAGEPRQVVRLVVLTAK